MEFRILGPLEARERGRRIQLGAAKQRSLLGVLLLHANEAVSSDRLVDELWGERPPARALKLVQGHVSALRKLVGTDRILTQRPGYLIRIEAGELDLNEFERLTAQARRERPEVAADLLRQALRLWRGRALGDLRLEGFAAREAERLDELRLTAQLERVEADLALGRHAELVGELEALVEERPLHERSRGGLMLALYRAGRQAEALAVYRETRKLLSDELGLEPSEELRSLERRILSHDPELDLRRPKKLAPPPPPEGFRADFPPPRTLEARPNTLPVQPSSLIGRRRELEQICALLSRADVRLLTLTGPGGIGKTRLALQAAAELLDQHPDGTFFVGLDSVATSELVIPTIAQTLGLRKWPGRTIAQTLSDYLERKAALLVLDSFEHVIVAAPAIAELLACCPELGIVVTSREPLRLLAEQQYEVSPLPADDALALFVARAQAVKPDFAVTTESKPVIQEICDRLDALPLAIELAASRVKPLPLLALCKRLSQRLALLTGGARDAPARHRTLRATIDWSFDLLDRDEQALLAYLGIFPGTFSLPAAEAICGAELNGLGSLVDKSLLRKTDDGSSEPRFFFLDTIREYALERLRQSGELEALRRRHADYFVVLAEHLDARRFGPDEVEMPRLLRAERSNIRAILFHALERDELEPAFWLVGLLYKKWEEHLGWEEETRVWLHTALSRSPRPTPARVAALLAASLLDWAAGDYGSADAEGEEALAMARAIGDRELEQGALTWLGSLLAAVGREAEGRASCEQGLALARELGDSNVSGALNNLGEVVFTQGDFVRARLLWEEGLALNRRAGAPLSIANALRSLSWLAIHEHDYETAVECLDEALAISRDATAPLLTAEVLTNLGWAELLHDSPASGARYFTEALAGYEQGRNPRVAVEVLFGLAASALDLGKTKRAAMLAAAAEALIDRLGTPLSKIESEARDRIRTASAPLAWDQGIKMDVEKAVSLALDDSPSPAREETGMARARH
jgi:predicted ATPase/DNA-binding SARP family transcriptional activator